MVSRCSSCVLLAALVIFNFIMVSSVEGHGGIRRRAWGRVHMLRSGKRSNIAPLPEEPEVASVEDNTDLLLPPLLHGLYRQQALLNQPDVDEMNNNNELESDIADFSGNYGANFPLLGGDRTPSADDTVDGEIKFIEDGEAFPVKRGFGYQRRPAWGGAHMLRSGKRSALELAKRASFWEGHGRPRWGGAHMLRSGRSDPSMQEMIENMNNGRTTDII